MYLTIKQQIKHLSKEDYRNLRRLCRVSKNLMNRAIWLNRQYFFKEGKYLGSQKTYAEMKNDINYKILNSNMAQQSLKVVDGMFHSFIALLRLVKKKKYDSRAVKMPNYLPKDGFAPLVIQQFKIKDGMFVLPYSRMFDVAHPKISIRVPTVLEGKNVKFVKIIPKLKAKLFEIQYVYEVKSKAVSSKGLCYSGEAGAPVRIRAEQPNFLNENLDSLKLSNVGGSLEVHYTQEDSAESQNALDKRKALAVDFGINNLMTCATSGGQSFIIDGRRLKSVNQWYNKRNAQLASIKDKQKYGKRPTNQQMKIALKRGRRVNDYISKACRRVINYCLKNRIGKLVCGYSVTFQRNSNLGKVTNQNFVQIPFGEIRKKLEYLCSLYGVEYVEQEESYTSKASFVDRDEIPVYNDDNPQEYEFSGKRIKRGLYRTADGSLINADLNGALNILRKSKVVSLEGLYSRGELDTPIRIRVW